MNTPAEVLKGLIGPFLQSNGFPGIVVDPNLGPAVPWRPHLYHPTTRRAWHILADTPPTSSWLDRMRAAQAAKTGLLLGVCAPREVLQSNAILQVLDEINAAVFPFEYDEKGALDLTAGSVSLSACEFVYEANLALEPKLAREMLDRAFRRALSEKNKHRKGTLFEVSVALMLSQVDGFKVLSRGISARNQQMDVQVDNRNVGTILAGGPVVLAEAKNWKSPPETKEFQSFESKVKSRRGRCKLGFFVASGDVTSGVYEEERRASKEDHLIVILDGKAFTNIWRTHKTVTEGIEAATHQATIDMKPG
jgi:hypothetical protein